jgi:hypothetical protein
MFILPFHHSTVSTLSTHVSTFQFLIIGRSSMWKEECTLENVSEILHTNGMYLAAEPMKWKEILLCPVDIQKTNMADFYRWEELPESHEMFCWKTVYILGSEPHTHNGLALPNETVGAYSYTELVDVLHQSSKPSVRC